jgi:L-arabinose transport system ATP-binding protein
MSDLADRPQARESAPALEAVHVTKRFGSVRALDDVTLAIHSGEILALVGENGAGKSTLVRVFEGVFPPDQGEVLAQGVRRTIRSPSEAHALGIRVIHQEPDIVPDLSIAENLFLGDFKRVGGIFLDRSDLVRRTFAMLREFGLENDIGPWVRAGDLRPAQRQLMEIMRALRGGLRVLALDEPTSSLTEEESQRLFGVVRRLRDNGVAVIYISHRMREVRDLADRIAVLRDGRLVAVRRTEEFPETDIVHAMVGRPVADLFDREGRRRGGVALSVRGLTTKRVRGVTFEVHSGEVIGLAGLMGAGRSELAEAIFGHDRLLAGSVAVEGRPQESGRRDQRRNRLRSRGPEVAGAVASAQCEGQSLADDPRPYQPAVLHRLRRRTPDRDGAGRAAPYQDPEPRSLRIQPLGRQPAEGGPRPLARAPA